MDPPSEIIRYMYYAVLSKRTRIACRKIQIYCHFIPLFLAEVSDEVHGHGEDDGAVLLGGDAVECLQVAQLQRPGARRDHLAGGAQRGARLLLALGRDHLRGGRIEQGGKLQCRSLPWPWPPWRPRPRQPWLSGAGRADARPCCNRGGS